MKPSHDKIVSLITQQYPNARLVYLFGSQADGTAKAGSDWDIAIAGNEKLTSMQRWQLQELLANALATEVDLIDLLDTTTVLQMQVVTSGKVIYQQNGFADDFAVQVMSMYGRLQEGRADILHNFSRTVSGGLANV